MERKANHRWIALALLSIIVLTGAILRTHGLGNVGYTPDELFSIHHASLAPKEILGNAENEPHPPLYYIMLHFWMEVFGDSQVATRSLSSLLGTVSIFLMYLLGRLLFNRETGMIASLMVAISAFHILYSQESRMYSLTALLTLASMFFFIKMTKEKGTASAAYYLLSSTLLMYTHIYGLFILLCQNIYVSAISLRSADQKPALSLKKWVGLQMVLVVAFVPWIGVLAHQIIGIGNGSFVNLNWLPPPRLSDLFGTFSLYAYYSPITLTLLILLSLSVLVTITHGKFGRNVDMQRSDTSLFLFLWLLIPIVVPFVLSGLAFPFYYARYTLPASFALYMLTSRGLSRISNGYLKGSLLAAVIFFSLTSVADYFH